MQTYTRRAAALLLLLPVLAPDAYADIPALPLSADRAAVILAEEQTLTTWIVLAVAFVMSALSLWALRTLRQPRPPSAEASDAPKLPSV